MNKFKQTSQSPIGTSFHDTVINASVNDLTKVLGEPQYDANHGTDKVNFEWMMELNDGSVFTVYDWKEYRVLDKREIIEWHIGGLNGIVTERAKEFILEALQGAKDEWDKVIDNYKETQLSHYHHFTNWNQDHHEFITFLKEYYDAPVAKPVEEKPEIIDVDYYTVNVFHVNYKGTEYVVRYNGDYDDYLVSEWDILDEDGTIPSKDTIYKLIDHCTPKVKTIIS